MSRSITIVISDAAFANLERNAIETAVSPAELAATALEERYRDHSGMHNGISATLANPQEARDRLARHFGAVDLGYSTGADNEAIDANLARIYVDPRFEQQRSQKLPG